MVEITNKIEEFSDFSLFEIILFNYYIYGLFSVTMKHHMRQISIRQELERESEVIQTKISVDQSYNTSLKFQVPENNSNNSSDNSITRYTDYN